MRRTAIRTIAVLLIVFIAVASGSAPVAASGEAVTGPLSATDELSGQAPAVDIDIVGTPLQANEDGIDVSVEDEDDGDGDDADDEGDDEEPATVDEGFDPDEANDEDEGPDSDTETGVGAATDGDPTAAPETPETPDTDTEDEDEDESDDGSGAEAPEADGDEEGEEDDDGGLGGGQAGGVSDVGDDSGSSGIGGFLDPGEHLGGMIEWTFEDIREGIIEFIDRFAMFFTSFPAPGEIDDPLSWAWPDDPVWQTVWSMYWTLVILSVPFWGLNVMQALSLSNPKERQAMLKENLLTLVSYPSMPFLIGLFCHTVNAIAEGFTPGAEEFLASPDALAQLGVGVVLGAILAKASPVIIFIGVAIIVFVAVVVMVSSALTPLAMTGRSSGWNTARSMGNLVITSILLLGMLRVMQSILLYLFYAIPVDELSLDVLVVFLLINAIGLYYILYRLPKEVINKTFAANAMTLGVSYMRDDFSISQAVQNTKSVYNRNRKRLGKAGGWVNKRLPKGVQRGGGSNGSSSGSSSGSGSSARNSSPPKMSGDAGSTASPSTPKRNKRTRPQMGSQSTRPARGPPRSTSSQSRNMKRPGSSSSSGGGQ